jgi:hypothetical protein
LSQEPTVEQLCENGVKYKNDAAGLKKIDETNSGAAFVRGCVSAKEYNDLNKDTAGFERVRESRSAPLASPGAV